MSTRNRSGAIFLCVGAVAGFVDAIRFSTVYHSPLIALTVGSLAAMMLGVARQEWRRAP